MPNTKPKSRNKVNLLVILGIIVSTLIIVVIIKYIDNMNQKRKEQTFSCNVAFKDGDLVFRKGRSVESQVVLIADRKSSYSHVGVVYMLNNIPYVINAVPDKSSDGIAYIKMEKLSVFFSAENASIGSVFRLKKQFTNMAELATLEAKSFYDAKIVFDDAFDMDSDNKLYCTELVWKAFKMVGIDLIQGKFDKLFLPFVKGFVILPSSLLHSSSIEEIYYFNHY